MNTTIFNRKVTDAELNIANCMALSQMYTPYPESNLRLAIPGILSPDENVDFRPLDSLCPPAAWVIGNGTALIWVGGTSGNIHVPQLLAGWSSVYDDWQTSYGASGAFFNAAMALKASFDPAEFASINTYYLMGHSYGGAVVQALAAILLGAGRPTIKVWSYGSPRPGLFRLGTFLSSVTNTRFFTDDDPVRFIPPHSSEVPSLTYLESVPLVMGCNTQVQAPNGWELQADGKIVETEGNPTALTAVALSIIRWCMDESGFRSVNHALPNYINRFRLALAAQTPVIEYETVRPREEPEVLTVRERERIADVGQVQVQNNLAVVPNVNTAYLVPQLAEDSPLRYRRRRVGKVWGVKLGDEVVAIGPGKRDSLRIARQFNRAARATQ